MKLNRLAYKLQTALLSKGITVKINQYQAYSQKAERMVTKYVVVKETEIKGKRKNETILKTCQMAEVVKHLAWLYDGGDG